MAREIAQVERLGVGIETDVIVGRTVTVDSLLGEEGFDAVFIGSGAGLPRFMGIDGVMYAGPIADLVATIVCIILVVLEMRRLFPYRSR